MTSAVETCIEPTGVKYSLWLTLSGNFGARNYLTLQQHRKWTVCKRDVQEGDIVLVQEKDANRNDWPVGHFLVKTDM